MIAELLDLFHPRIRTACERLFLDAHFPQAAAEAFKQVELALKERTGYRNLCGVRLVQRTFQRGPGIRLVTPLGEDAQKAAAAYCQAAFTYYRNHAVHDGRGIDEAVCSRCLIVATELLEMVGASAVRFDTVEELGQLAAAIGIAGLESLRELLRFLDGYVIVDDVLDGLYEELAERGWGDFVLEFVFDTGLAEYVGGKLPATPLHPMEDGVELATFDLTDQGREIVSHSG